MAAKTKSLFTTKNMKGTKTIIMKLLESV